MSSESNFSFTTKVNGDLFTVRGDTYDQFLANLTAASQVAGVMVLVDALEGRASADMAAAVNTVQAAFPGATTVGADPFGGWDRTAPAAAPVAPPVASVSVGDKTCKHGVMVKRTGNGAKGEWRAFFCPTPKGTPDQCSAEFASRGTPEWASF